MLVGSSSSVPVPRSSATSWVTEIRVRPPPICVPTSRLRELAFDWQRFRSKIGFVGNAQVRGVVRFVPVYAFPFILIPVLFRRRRFRGSMWLLNSVASWTM